MLPAIRTFAVVAVTSLTTTCVVAAAAPARAEGALTAPSLSVVGSTHLLWTVTLPADPDLTAVHLRYNVGSVAPSSPADGTALADYATPGYSPGQSVTDSLMQGIDPNLTYTIVAFAEDSSDNVTSTEVVRPAATESEGAPVSNVGYQALGDGTTEVFYPTPGQQIYSIRYAAGATPPHTADDGTAAAMLSSAWGTYAVIPAPVGQTVSVSMFNLGPASANTYQALRFTITGGTSTDVLFVKAPKSAAVGTVPTFTATFVRFGPQGTVPLGDVHLDLWAKVGGSSMYSSTGIGAITAADGTASFTPHFPQTSSTTYQVRADVHSTDPLDVVSAFAVPSTTPMTAALSKTVVKHGHAVTINGTLSSAYMVTVALQRSVDGEWKTIAHAVTFQTLSKSQGPYALHYKLSYQPGSAGKQRLRVYLPADKRHTSAASATLKLTVR